MSRLKMLLIVIGTGLAIYFLVPLLVTAFLKGNPTVFLDDEVSVTSARPSAECFTFTSDREMTVEIAASDDISLLVFKPQDVQTPSLQILHTELMFCSDRQRVCGPGTDRLRQVAPEMALLGGYHPSIRNRDFTFDVEEDELICVLLFSDKMSPTRASRLVNTIPR